MEFYFPTETGEQMAFLSAATIAVLGLIVMLAPGLALRFFGLQAREGRFEGYAETRSAGAFYAASALPPILLAQNLMYLALGAAMALAAFARILSIMSDQGGSLRNILLLIVQIALAACPLAYGLAMI
ncbi:DUF4345 domain-containing protein [Rhizobium sp. CG5]|uniref:AGROH133_08824 family phage infection protein n=1 Tax=Rhizobium sp. CG5 TaxID=2726076 RepID=UPI0020345511|nr:DUF4345 domain-containing protein [Rhizobium sp. CG5]MCM2475274.1 DUF4345 domain-containing protein [Rhizobium sp. CG5]